MPSPEYDDIRNITNFKSLIKYLRKDLNWPVDEELVDDLSFDYKAAELGIDDTKAVKIKEIKQLRPLTGNQPWGVFWIQFEQKQLPVVVMRRILSALVRKQRGKRGSQKTWDLPDLMFISATGAGNERGISFAHFQEVDGKPQLRTFAWDVKETHLYYIKNLNLNALRWPVDARDVDAWRRQWGEAFTVAHREVPRTAEMLANKMAQIASYIRETVELTYSMEHAGGSLHQLHLNLKLDLISDLTEDDFADMYAQTVTYGLFAARATRSGDFAKGADGGGTDAAALIEHTNPFLRELLEQMTNQQSIDLDELGVTELTDLLGKVNMEAILQDFGRQKKGEDPVIHFYETFMREYDPQQKTKRGEFYTPDAVVSFIVRSVDHLLRTEFDCADGLLSTASRDGSFSPVFLDPATGTGTFLRYIVMVAYETFHQKNKKLSYSQRKEKWNQYVRESLLPRLYAFELKMSPYTIAHMKVGLTLQEFGFEFRDGERLQIYLTNALQPSHEVARVDTPALTHEAERATEVKTKAPVTIMVGNPPYANFGMMNKGDWISELINDYKKGLNEKKLNLDDDFIKFIRFGHSRIEQSGKGILAFITSNTYVDGLTHRRMRQSLGESFDAIYILNLHGNTLKGENPPDGQRDENVFDIQQGVAISIFVKKGLRSTKKQVFYADLWGKREDKYSALLTTGFSSINWQLIDPVSPYFFFAPKDFSFEQEYKSGYLLSSVFQDFQNGIKTDRDELFIDFESKILADRMKMFYSAKGMTKEFVEQYNIVSSSSFDIVARRKNTKFDSKFIQPFLYRPFDVRWLYYNPKLTSRPAWEIMRHVLEGRNLGLITTRQTSDKWGLLATKNISGHKSCAAYDINSFFPLYLYPADIGIQSNMFAGNQGSGLGGRLHNLDSDFIVNFEKRLKLKFVTDDAGDLRKTFGPEDVFHYIYAVFHSPAYRSRYAEFLKIDFPRLPLTSNVELFRQLCGLGKELVALHLLEASTLNKPITKFKGKGDNIVAKGHPKYQDGVVLVNASQGFEGVPEGVWEFHIGGYQVCEKWLKDRRGRELSAEDIVHYGKVVVSLHETIRLMGEVDGVIESAGGWPVK